MGMGPMVRITVEHMAHQVVMALGSHYEMLEEDLKTAVKEAVAGFDFKGTLKKMAQAELEKQMKDISERAMREALAERYGDILRFTRQALDSALINDAAERLGATPRSERANRQRR